MYARFRSLSAVDRQQVSILIASMALFLFHITWFSIWQIEDAAISYAYARNFALGDGFVTNVGGEWVEGFSNPTWTLLLAGFVFLGADPFAVGKLAGATFGLATLPLAWLWARRLAGPDTIWPAFVPLALAMSTQHALWAVAGLENGLFSFLLTAGVLLILREGDRGGIAWSGPFLGLLAFSRPEAPLYSGLITLVCAPAALRKGGVRWGLSFLLLSGGPFLAWHAWRYWAFAWEFPNTYYAKLGEKKFFPWRWSVRCWAYLRGWSLNSAHILLLPVFALGAAGERSWARWGAGGAVGILWLLVLPGLTFFHDFFPEDTEFWSEPKSVMYVRVPWLVGTALLLTGLLVWRGRDRGVAAVLALAVLFFAVISGGDWMRGYRWMSMCAVPLSVLLMDATSTVGKHFVRRDRAALFLAMPVLLANIGQTIDHLSNIDTSPFDVRRRVLYTQGVRDRLHLDHIQDVEVDMGGNLYWSGFEMLDLAGLCNVPVARNNYPTWFVDSYFQHERPTNFAHIHGSWAPKTKVYKRRWFLKEFLAIPGFGHSFFPFLHQGNFLRRSTFVEPVWAPGIRSSTFDRRIRLDDLRIPAPQVHAGGALYVEVAWSARKAMVPFRALLFLHKDGQVVTREMPPAYDWLPVNKWRTQFSHVGRHTFSLPEDLESGAWDVGVLVFGDRGVLETVNGLPPILAQGEQRWIGVVQVEPQPKVEERATLSLGHAVNAARSGACEEADEHWSSARRHLARDHVWHTSARPAADQERGRCWASKALTESDADMFQRGKRLAPRDLRIRAVGQELADHFVDEAELSRSAGDAEGMWKGWSRALVADPTRSWLRRDVEELREGLFGGKKKK